MKSPSGSSAISHEWVEFVVQHHEAKAHPDVTVKLSSFSVVPATKPGESFNSELVRVDASAELRQGDSKDDSSQHMKKDYSFIIKFLSINPFIRELGKATNQHLKEFVIYSKLINELNSYWEANATCLDVDQKICAPEYIYGICASSEYVLVLENCKESKFETNDKHKGLDLAQTLLAVEQVARLHALSHSYNQTTNICEKYQCLKFSHANSGFLKVAASGALMNAENFCKNFPEYKNIASKLEKGGHKIIQKFQSLYEDQSQHKILCLTHGDLWNSNLLFGHQPASENGDRNIEAVKLIDWQNAQWNNPVVDIHYLLSTSINPEMRDNHLDEILRHYHSTFMHISENVKTPVPDWNYEQFYAEFSRMSLVGFLLGLCLVQGTLSKAGEKVNPNASGSSSGQSDGYVARKLKTAGAKVMVPLLLKPSSQFLIKKGMKKMLDPVYQELVGGQNTVLNERFLGLIIEADKRGLFDGLGS